MYKTTKLLNTKRKNGITNLAFTLAEVLITLGIIGIVAAMTLPTLITKYQKKQTVNQLKKAYSEISQAIQLAQVEHGLMETWDYKKSTEFYENCLRPNMKIIKECTPTNSNCWADKIYTLDNKKVTGMKNLVNEGNTWSISYITGSGYSVLEWLDGDGTRGWFYVDLNGPKSKPNQIGKDIFSFRLEWKPKSKGLLAAGLDTENTERVTKDDLINNSNGLMNSALLCKKNSNSVAAGVYCSGVIAIDGWEIKDDYPW